MKRRLSLMLAILLAFTFISCAPDPVKVSTVTLDKESVEIVIGNKETLKATVLPLEADDKSVAWTSADPEIAAVDASGVVTGIAVGETTINATAGDITATAKVKVVIPAVSSVTLDKTSETLTLGGDTLTLKATVLPDLADKTITWTTSDDKVATVVDGVVTAAGKGEATITAKAGDKTATCKVSVVLPAVTSITLDKTSETLTLGGDTLMLKATVLPDLADKTITWTTSDDKVATVVDGVVIAVGKGEATITAKAGDKTATCIVTVVLPAVEAVTLDKTSETLTLGGATLTLKATVSPDLADKTITWTTSDDKVATVVDGVVSAIGKGEATITAKAGDKTATCTVTVVLPVVESVTLDKTSETLTLGGATLTLKATVLPDLADKAITWTTDNDKVATVADGVVTAVGKGEATITAKAGDKTATCTVVALPAAESVSLDKTEVLLNKLKSNDDLRHEQALKAKVLPENADQSVTWTSSNPELVTVDENGLVKAVYDQEGTATITAKTENGKEAKCTVYVGKVDYKIDKVVSNDWEGGYTLSFKYIYSIPELEAKTTSILSSSDSTICDIDQEHMTIKLADVTENKKFLLSFRNDAMGINAEQTVTVFPRIQKIMLDIDKTQHYMFKNLDELDFPVKTNPENASKLVFNRHFDGAMNPILQGGSVSNRVIFELGHTHFQLESYNDNTIKSDEYEIFLSPGTLDDKGYWKTEGSAETVFIPNELKYPDSTGNYVNRQVNGINRSQGWTSPPYFTIDNIIILGDFTKFDIPTLAFSSSPIKKINIPSNATVDYEAFAGSTNLESVFIGKNVKFGFDNIFKGCTALKTIWMEDAAPDDNSRPAWAPEGVEIVYGKTFDEFWPDRWKPSSEKTPSV